MCDRLDWWLIFLFCLELDFILRFLAIQKLKQVRLWSFGLIKTFQKLSWADGKRTPLNGKRLKKYIMSMHEVVEEYHRIKAGKI